MTMAISKQVKTAIVTGGSRGIGAAAAIKLAQSGYNVVIASRQESAASIQVMDTIEKTGVSGMPLYGNVQQSEFCKSLVEQAFSRFGRIDTLVHCAGGANPGSILDSDTIEAAWYEAFDTHVHSAFHMARFAVPLMKQSGNGGALVFIASSAALRGIPNGIPYSTAKGALYQFSRALAAELAEFNIRANTVSPGMIETRFHKDLTPENRAVNLNQRIPMKRAGTPEETAEVILMLAENAYITGENVTIDGGLTMRVR